MTDPNDTTPPEGDDPPTNGDGDGRDADVLDQLARDLSDDADFAAAVESVEASLQERAEADPRSREELLAAVDEAQRRAEAAEATAEEYLDALQRRQAEFDNFRRRNQRVAADQRQAGVGDLATALLDVADDLDGAVGAAADEDSPLAKGVALLREKLLGVLRANGIERVDEVDVPFDPTRHEAVQRVDRGDDDPQGETVAQVYRPGYVQGDKVLRAAMVVVRQ